MKKSTTIKCPNCECEYLPGEIYLPDYFLGQPTNVIRGFENNVLAYDGQPMDLEEEYTCDKCGKKFKVKATVTFKTEIVNDIFADEEYVSRGE